MKPETKPEPKKPLDRPSPMDYTGTDTGRQPQKPLSREEAKDLLDAYGREKQGPSKKDKRPGKGEKLDYKDW